MCARHQPFIAVAMGRKDQRQIRDACQTAGDRVLQKGCAFKCIIGKDVLAILVLHRKMRVQPVTRVVIIWLGHETGRHPVVAGKAAHQHLEKPRIICGFQRIGDMFKVHLELADPAFGNRGLGGNIHRTAGVIKLVEEFIEGVERA